jgi:hypothetical protein
VITAARRDYYIWEQQVSAILKLKNAHKQKVEVYL